MQERHFEAACPVDELEVGGDGENDVGDVPGVFRDTLELRARLQSNRILSIKALLFPMALPKVPTNGMKLYRPKDRSDIAANIGWINCGPLGRGRTYFLRKFERLCFQPLGRRMQRHDFDIGFVVMSVERARGHRRHV